MEIIDVNNRIKNFMSGVDVVTSARVKKTMDALKIHGHLLGMSDSKSLGRGLFELRTLGKTQIRIIYIFHKNKVYFIHIFIKKFWKINIRDIEYARRIQKEITRLV